ncbi:MAG: carboxymuconolactone decarboxylase family protein [candidate division Zixibacteria bacterium]|nr:carboxymuconolactone decarboxylase family protein [candidate division Zixibacteria bacterium]
MMNNDDINKYYDSLDISINDDRIRALAFLSALIAESNQEHLLLAFRHFREIKFDTRAVYETILQSYLFLGFPRMIEAAIAFNEIYGSSTDLFESDFGQINSEESTRWFKKGITLCKQVYGNNYERLKERFISISPEMFRWMVIEGYGKVLTRPGLNSVERELAEVAALIVDKRERQLISHIIGSLNVGASVTLIKQVNDDIRLLAGKTAYKLANYSISKVESNNDSAS